MSDHINDDRAQLLTINHTIRTLEHELEVARRRRKWSNLSLGLGPIFAVLLYSLLWIPWIPERAVVAVSIPMIPVTLALFIASYLLKSDPGGPAKDINGKRARRSEGQLELELAREREIRKHLLASADVSTRVRRIEYKEDAYNDIDELRTESKRYRRLTIAYRASSSSVRWPPRAPQELQPNWSTCAG